MERVVRVVISSACLVLVFSCAALALAGPVERLADAELAARGKALFTGAEPLAGGGAPCAACHPFRALGITGGTLAADLTDLHEGLGEEGLQVVLGNLDFPVMKKIYADRPLTDEEIVTLIMFTRSAQTGTKGGASLFPLAGVGFFVCFLAILMIYKRRIQ